MDVFISYRRNGGEAWAALIKGELEKKGVTVFLDKHNIKSGDFEKALENSIKNADNFLLVLSPGIFDRDRNSLDYVRNEIVFATQIKKNIIPVIVNGYSENHDFSGEKEEIRRLSTMEAIYFSDIDTNHLHASVSSIIDHMIDKNGLPWTGKDYDNSSWYGSSLSEEDRLWMTTNYEVCKPMAKHIMQKILNTPLIKSIDKVNYFNLCLYDVECISDLIKPEVQPEDNRKDIQVYGFAHDYNIEQSCKVFGEDHFIVCTHEKDFREKIEELLKLNHLKYFDIMEMTLSLKDCENQEDVLRTMSEYINPNGGIIYIRDLDDDLLLAYPDEKDYIKKLVALLKLDPGAGNRHFGKRIYTCLQKAGADRIYMSNECVSTANVKSKTQKKIFDAYFSYLLPEFRGLVESNPDNEEYKSALEWLNRNYSKVESLFCSKEFYFRAGFIAGYGEFYESEEEDD